MSTATRKQLESSVREIGSVLQQVIGELGNLKDLAIGTMTVVKELPGYEEALQTMKTKQEEKEKEQEKETKLDL